MVVVVPQLDIGKVNENNSNQSEEIVATTVEHSNCEEVPKIDTRCDENDVKANTFRYHSHFLGRRTN
jgi:hypothetical protein